MSWRNRWTGLSLALISLVASTSCASLGPSGAYEPPGTELVVQNRGWENVTVFAVRGPVAIRVGSVDGMSTRTFALTPAILGPGGMIQLKGLRRISGEQFLSTMFDMGPGTSAQWVIETNANLSHVRVR
jgi:hypothetical protein